jgi:hypothetical protein
VILIENYVYQLDICIAMCKKHLHVVLGLKEVFHLIRNVAQRSVFLCFVNTTGVESGRTNYVDTKEYAAFHYGMILI